MGVNGQRIRQQVHRNQERERDADGGRGKDRRREVCQVREDMGGKSSKKRPRDTGFLSFSIFLFLSPRSLIPAVSLSGKRPTSSFVYPGMWNVLTGWLFIDSTQLRVPPVAFSLSLSCVCVSTPLSLLSANQALPRKTGCWETHARERKESLCRATEKLK